MFSLWNFFLTRRQFSFLLFGVLALWGLALAFLIQKESAPEVQVPVGVVTVTLPGASAEDVERLVTNKIEAEISGLTDINTITSTSGEGIATIVAEFSAQADIDESIRALRDEVEKAKPELPADANDPIVSEVNFVDQPILIVAIAADTLPQGLTKVSEDIERALEAIPSVSRVDVSGVQKKEVHVLVESSEVARHGLSFSDVVNAIRFANASAPSGSIVTNGVEYPIRFEGSITSPTDVPGIALQSTSGSLVYVRDLATVIDGVENPKTAVRLSHQGEPSQQALLVSVYKNRDADVTRTSKEVLSTLDELSSTFLSGSNIVPVLDSGELVEEDLTSLTGSGIITVLLVMSALILTIGWREAIIAGLSIPLSFLIAFIGLFYSGNTINFVSLFSLILAVGILVDAGIVIVEAMVVRLRQGLSRLEAARASLREFAWPLIAGTATTIAVFVPLFFISGVTGQFIASIPFTIIFVLIAAQIVALAVLPLLVITFSQEGAPGSGKLGEIQAQVVDAVRAWYRKNLDRALSNARFQRNFLIGLTVAFVVALLLPMFGVVRSEFFPGGDVDYVFMDLELPQGSTLTQTDFALRALEEVVLEAPGIENFVVTAGRTSEFGGSPQSGDRFGNVLLLLSDNRSVTSGDLVSRLRTETAAYGFGTVRIDEPQDGPPVGAPILIKLFGQDLDTLSTASDQVKSLLENLEGVTDVRVSGEDGGVEFVLSSDRSQLASVGLSSSSLAQTLRTAVYGTEAASITTLGDDVRVFVRANLSGTDDPARANVATIQDVLALPVVAPVGETLVGSVVSVSPEAARRSIQHEDRERVLSVSANVVEGANTLEVVDAFRSASNDIALPDGVRMVIGGENEEVDQSFTEMFYALIAGILLMFAVVVLLFNSFRLSLYTLLTVPLTLIGVIGGLLLTAKPISFPALLGVIALAGVVINNAIVLVDSFVSRLRENPATDYKEALLESAVSRLRPVLLTALTTIIGMTPLLFSAAIWAPLAYSIMFGLAFATILTLLLIPILLLRGKKHILPLIEEAKKASD